MFIPVLSKEYYKVPATFVYQGVAQDPSGDVVQFAFKADGVQPASGDWVAGSWEKATVGSATVYLARIDIGVGGDIVLAAGVYRVWIKVVDSPEIPVRWLTDLLTIG